MANEKNLKKFKKGDVSHEEAVRRGSLGGKARAKKIKERKTMKEMLEILLDKEITNNKGETATTLEAISVSLIKKAMSGDVRAFEVLRDTIGQKPTDKVEQTSTNININDEKIINNVLDKIKEI